jgi:hypothetical protein
VQQAPSYMTQARINEQRIWARKRRSLVHLTAPVHFSQAPPAKSTRSHTSKLRQPTQASAGKLHQANAVMQLQ